MNISYLALLLSLFFFSTTSLHHKNTQLLLTDGETQQHQILKMTTQELTLNLTGITFPGPHKQGDVLNLTGITIQTQSKPVVKTCGNGYYLDQGICKLADLLLMQDLQAQSLIVGSLNLEEIKQRQQQFIQKHPDFVPLKCEGQTPYLSKVGCIACKAPHTYFNIETIKCSKCPSGSEYNPIIRNCQQGGNQYLSNLENKNYLVDVGKSLSDYETNYKILRQQNENLKTCPIQTPFSIGAECVTCPTEKPLFLLPARSCTICPQGTKFSSEQNQCLSSETNVVKTGNPKRRDGGEKWTVVKGLGNIFGWNNGQVQNIASSNQSAAVSNKSNSKSSQTTVQSSSSTSVTKEVQQADDENSEKSSSEKQAQNNQQ